MAWLALLRGFCLVLIPVTVLFLIYFLFSNKQAIKQLLIALVMFTLPFIFFESIWIVRNYVSLHKFIPLQTSFVPGSDSKNPEYNNGMVTKNSMMSVRKLIFAWGGNNTWYFKNSDMAWFVRRNDPAAKNFKFDNSIFFDGFTQDSLAKLKSSIVFSFENLLPPVAADSVETVISSTAERYYNNFVRHKKIYYYFYAPIKRFKHYLLKNPTQDWPGPSFNQSTIVQKFAKLLSVFQYAVLLFALLLFPVVYFFKKKHDKISIFYPFLYLLLLTSIIPFITIIYMSHYSYFIFGYILLIPLFIFTLDSFIRNKING